MHILPSYSSDSDYPALHHFLFHSTLFYSIHLQKIIHKTQVLERQGLYSSNYKDLFSSNPYLICINVQQQIRQAEKQITKRFCYLSTKKIFVMLFCKIYTWSFVGSLPPTVINFMYLPWQKLAIKNLFLMLSICSVFIKYPQQFLFISFIL